MLIPSCDRCQMKILAECAVLTLTFASTIGYRATHSAGVILVVVAMSIMAVLSAALVQSIQ